MQFGMYMTNNNKRQKVTFCLQKSWMLDIQAAEREREREGKTNQWYSSVLFMCTT